MPSRKEAVDTPPTETAEPLIDTTAPLSLHSKRTSRLQKKRNLKTTLSKASTTATLFDLPSELLLDIFSLLLPSDIFSLLRVSKNLQNFILQENPRIANTIIQNRYTILSQCFPRPILLENMDTETHKALLDEERQIKHLHIHKKPYQHIQSPDPTKICTCLTCILAWNNLCVVVDFAYWQKHLEKGEPIPMIPRGKNPKWNTKLIEAHAEVVKKAITNELWYSLVLQCHLSSTTKSIKRHTNNKGNKRRRFRMGKEDEEKETDEFLARSGPPSLDFPFHRDNYYMLEAYAPNRGWFSQEEGEGEWRYMPESQHERDVEFVRGWKRAKERRAKEEREKEEKERANERGREWEISEVVS